MPNVATAHLQTGDTIFFPAGRLGQTAMYCIVEYISSASQDDEVFISPIGGARSGWPYPPGVRYCCSSDFRAPKNMLWNTVLGPGRA
jgi:hypothetical protein